MYEHDPTFAGLEGFVAELVGAGVAHACVMPGARSTPLALTLVSHPRLRAWSHIDERSGAFFALGIAKATRRPVAVACTSGTAAANLLPAAVEASYAHVPLLLLTADRPPELRDCGARQTIDQIKLYGTHVKWFAEAGMADAGQQYFRTLARQAVARACANPPGPVHLNFPFREPLMPRPAPPARAANAAEETADFLGLRPSTGSGRAEKVNDIKATTAQAELVEAGFVSLSTLPEAEAIPELLAPAAAAAPPDAAVRALAATLAATPRGLIVCGPQDAGAAFAPAVTALAKLLGYPILADPTSQVRSGSHDTSLVVDAYDTLLRDETFARNVAPDVILRFGPLPTAKAFTNYLQQHPRCRQIVVDPQTPWNDPTSTATDMAPWDPVITCDELCRRLSDRVRRADEAWQVQWMTATRRVRRAIQSQLEGLHELFEGKVFAELARLLPEGSWLYVGNSMPVRDLESFWPAGSRTIRFLSNRGANGIDGFISSGLGAAAVSEHPVVIVTGDLAFYHDLNGLLAAKRHGVRATIIVINNDGGGIFSFLPQAQCGDQAAEYFFTPHGLDFRGAVEMYGCGFTRVSSWEQFRDAVAAALRAPQTQVIEVPSDRQRNVELHRQIWAAAARALA
ncbi:MAG: 2-succinyl-5-enolpyruvyl-6-hydroxy-3-cyclohexene-1-carboxylic-acid synthase [Candidatus Binatia bacterium]|jgi:2-succinyl-5-enolpyruvyl-6-hydroxy-3-cyclohexene-1-carboxylate synthase